MIDHHESGEVSFRVFAPHAGTVELVGAFTGWHDRPVPLEKGDDGWWRTTLALPEGDQEFQYLIDRREWRPDYAANGIRLNEFGTWVSIACVRKAERIDAPRVALAA